MRTIDDMMIRFAYFTACVGSFLHYVSAATGIEPGPSITAGWPLGAWSAAAFWLAIGFYAFFWRPQS